MTGSSSGEVLLPGPVSSYSQLSQEGIAIVALLGPSVFLEHRGLVLWVVGSPPLCPGLLGRNIGGPTPGHPLPGSGNGHQAPSAAHMSGVRQRLAFPASITCLPSQLPRLPPHSAPG